MLTTAKSALNSLDSADGWATYDVWTRGGILSHMAKYDAVDQAQILSSRLETQLKDLHKELADVNLQASDNFTAIDSTTRMVDFWFDNIFTNLNVRSIIRDNQQQLLNVCGKTNGVITTLNSNKNGIYKKINELEKNKEDLLLE